MVTILADGIAYGALLFLLALPLLAPLARLLGSDSLGNAAASFSGAAPWLGASLVGLLGMDMLLGRWLGTPDEALESQALLRSRRAGRWVGVGCLGEELSASR